MVKNLVQNQEKNVSIGTTGLSGFTRLHVAGMYTYLL